MRKDRLLLLHILEAHLCGKMMLAAHNVERNNRKIGELPKCSLCVLKGWTGRLSKSILEDLGLVRSHPFATLISAMISSATGLILYGKCAFLFQNGFQRFKQKVFEGAQSGGRKF